MPTFINPITLDVRKNRLGRPSATAAVKTVALYEAENLGASTSNNWLAFYADNSTDSPIPRLDMSTSLTDKAYFCVRCAYKNGGCYVMASQAPANPSTFLDVLNTYMGRLNAKKSYRRYFIWVANPDATTPENLGANAIPFINIVSAGGSTISTTEATELTFNGAKNISIQIPASQQINLTGEAFTFTAPTGGQSIQFREGGATFGETSSLTLDFSNAGGGQLRTEMKFRLGTNQPFNFGEVGGAFFANKGGKEAIIPFPVIHRPENSRLRNGHYDLFLDLAKPFDRERTALFFKPRPGIAELDLYTSPWKTHTGNSIFLKPKAGSAKLVFAQKSQWQAYSYGRFLPKEALYFNLDGDFELFLDQGQTADRTAFLLGGVSGTEAIGITAGDTMSFFSGKNAFSSEFPLDSSSATPISLAGIALEQGRTTSWVNFSRPAGQGNNLYFSQPENATLFSQALDSNGDPVAGNPVLNVFSTPSAELISGAASSFPLLPLNGIQLPILPDTFLEPFMLGEEDLELYEKQILNPIRNKIISDTHLAQPRGTRSLSGTTITTSPQGFVIEVDNDSRQWNSLLLANNTEVSSNPNLLEFKNLHPIVQNAFQTNELFLVISQPTDAAVANFFTNNLDGSVTDFDNVIEVAGWPMVIDTMDKSAFTDASDFNNVFIIKYAGKSIAERINDVRQWTNPAAFNDASNYTALQTWINKFIADTRANVVGANASPSEAIADKGLLQFLNIIDDPNWTGILAMKVSIDLKNIPESIKCIIAGVDTSKFNAHHFGVEANQMKLDNDGLGVINKTVVQSSLFGLISYYDEDFLERKRLNTTTPPPVIAADYDFTVLNLQVLFQNSEIADFNCNIQLTLNKLFNDAVLSETVLDPEATKGNSIILKGSFQRQNGKGSYIFTQEIPDTLKIESHFLEEAKIGYITFSAGNKAEAFPDGTTSPHELLTTRFALKGDLKFHKIDDFDIFSFDKLSYSSLHLDMVFAVEDTGGKKFYFKPTETRFSGFSDTNSTTRNSSLRANSLIRNFPIEVQGISAWQPFSSPSKKPQDLGYLVVDTPTTIKDIQDTSGTTIEADEITTTDINDEWYALKCRVNLGSLGGLSQKGDLEAILLLTWSPGPTSSSLKPAQVFIKLPFTKGGSQVFGLQGVLNLEIEGVDFKKSLNSPQYAMGFSNVHLNLLGINLPAYNSIRVYLFGNPDQSGTTNNRHLGWYAVYNPEFGVSYGEGPTKIFGSGSVTVAPKNPMFEVRFLGVGQRLAMKNVGAIRNVNVAVFKMSTSFAVQNGTEVVIPELGNNIEFNPSSKWMVGLSAGIFKEKGKWLIDLGLVFNDPNLYAMRIGINGKRIEALDGTELEVMYKKITEDIGVWSAELKLPDSIRNIELGALSITLPLIGIAVYTNGGFSVNLGYPYLRDFSNSFSITTKPTGSLVPNTGAGGLYFTYLKGAATKIVKRPSNGVFDPLIQFGIGVNLGYGEKLDEGILEAEVKLLVVFFLEGIIGFYLPADKSDSDEVYYNVKGEIGIMGIIKGKINFSVIKAKLEVTVFILVFGKFEAYRAIELGAEAQIKVKLEVTIDLGLFDVTFKLSFKATVKVSAKIGSDSVAPWDPLITPQSESWVLPPVSLREKQTPIILDWARKLAIETGSNKPEIEVYYLPQFTIGKAAESDANQALQAINLLFIRNEITTDSDSITTDSEFEQLCIAMFAWVINADTSSVAGDQQTLTSIQEEEIASKLLYQLNYTLSHSDASIEAQETQFSNGIEATAQQDYESRQQAPFDYEALKNFLSALFTIKLVDSNEALKDSLEAEGNSTSLKLTIFPMIPELKADKKFTGDDSQTEEKLFNEKIVKKDFLEKVAELQQTYGSIENVAIHERTSDLSQPLSEIIFEDYFFMILKDIIQAAIREVERHEFIIPREIEVMDNLGVLAAKPVNLENISKHFQVSTLTIVKANKEHTTLLKAGESIQISGQKATISADETLKSTTEGLGITPLALAQLSLDEPFLVTEAVVQVDLGGVTEVYMIEKGDTLNTVIAEISGINTLSELVPHIEDHKSLFIYLNLPDDTHTIISGDSFLSLANQYAITFEQLITPNLNNTNLLSEGERLIIPNIHSIKFEALINIFREKDVFGQAASSTNRFFMHGLRLPEEATGSTYVPMYQLNNQTFTLPTVSDPANYPLTLGIQENDTASNWVTLPTGGIQHALRAEEIAILSSLDGSTLAPEIGASIAENLFLDSPKQFPFRSQVSWKENGTPPTSKTIWFFSNNLQNQLSSNPLLTLSISTKVPGQAKPSKEALSNDQFLWATWLDVTIRKIPSATRSGAMNDNIYEVFGSDAQGLEVLTALLEKLHQMGNGDFIEQLHLIYTSPDGKLDKGGKSEAADKTLGMLINTNLSTETNPEALLSQTDDRIITNSNYPDFIKRLWKASVVKSGGFYLYYENADRDSLPNDIFNDKGLSTLRILITYKPVDGTVPSGLSLNENQLSLLESYMNCVVLSQIINEEESLLIGDWMDNTEKVSKVPAGFIGFHLSRKNPDVITGLIPHQKLLEKQYNLLRYEIDETQTSIFKHPGEALPVGPIKEGETNDAIDPIWDYKKLFPIESIIDPNLLGSGPVSPYDQIGEVVPLKFSWQDNFGFINDQGRPSPISLNILYTDPLQSVGQWPSLSTTYSFDEINQLVLTLTYTPDSQYQIQVGASDVDKELVRKQAIADLAVYQSIFFQLQKKLVTLPGTTSPIDTLKIRVSVSMSNNDVEVNDADRSDLESFLTSIITRLSTISQNPESATLKPINFELRTAVTDNHPDDIYPLLVKLSFNRPPELVDPIIRRISDSPVNSVSSRIEPATDTVQTTADGDEKLLTSLQSFAENFETIFAPFKLKLAVVYQGERNQSETEIFVVRLRDTTRNKGIDFTINYNNPVFFAPEPLSHKMVGSNKLLSMDTQLHPYVRNQGIDLTQPINKSFQEVDPEIWANEFLETFEEVLRPDLSLSIAMVDQLKDTNHLQEILTAKATLAEAISLQSSLILEYDSNDTLGDEERRLAKEVAREKIRQQLLINLKKGYQIDTIVTHHISNISSQMVGQPIEDTRKPPQFFGNIYEKPITETRDEDAPNYSFSTGKLPIAGDIGTEHTDFAAMATVFNNVKDKEQNHIKIEWRYLISHMEVEIQQMPVEKVRDSNDPLNPDKAQEYFASKWLSFIRPFSYENRGGVPEIMSAEEDFFHTSYIPIPIRYYPIAPQLFSQQTTPEASSLVNPPNVADIKKYGYEFAFGTEEYVAQDQLDFTIRFNAKANDFEELSDGTATFAPKQLAIDLAQFMETKEDFINDFETLLPDVRGIKDLTDVKLQQADSLLTSYAKLVQDIANNWLSLYIGRRSRSLSTPPDVITVKFTLDEPKPADPTIGDQRFSIDLDKWSVSPSQADGVSVNIPTIFIEGYETDPAIITDVVDQTGAIIGQKHTFFFKKQGSIDEYLLFEEGQVLPRRNVRFNELDALLIQNAWAGVSVTRNAELMEEVPDLEWQLKKTAESFIYHTPLKVFVNPITPFIHNSYDISIPELHGQTGGALPLHEHFNSLFISLLSNLDSRGSTAINPTLGEVTLKLTCNYSYQLAENSLRVRLPVLLVMPSSFKRPTSPGQINGSEAQAIQHLCTSIKNWFNTELPEENNGQFHFDITFYSDLADDDKPVFRLRNLFLALSVLARESGTNKLI